MPEKTLRRVFKIEILSCFCTKVFYIMTLCFVLSLLLQTADKTYVHSPDLNFSDESECKQKQNQEWM